MTDCIFCKIVAKQIPAEIVHEDDNIVVFKDIYPSAPIHLLMIPKKHFASLQQAEPEDELLLGKMMLQVPQVAKQNGLVQGFKTQINTGKVAGQEVFHFHIHIMGKHS